MRSAGAFAVANVPMNQVDMRRASRPQQRRRDAIETSNQEVRGNSASRRLRKQQAEVTMGR